MEVSTIIVKQKDLGCGATKVHIIEQDLEVNDAQTRLFWKTLGGKAAVAGNLLYCFFVVLLVMFYLSVYFPFSSHGGWWGGSTSFCWKYFLLLTFGGSTSFYLLLGEVLPSAAL